MNKIKTYRLRGASSNANSSPAFTFSSATFIGWEEKGTYDYGRMVGFNVENMKPVKISLNWLVEDPSTDPLSLISEDQADLIRMVYSERF